MCGLKDGARLGWPFIGYFPFLARLMLYEVCKAELMSMLLLLLKKVWYCFWYLYHIPCAEKVI